MRRDWNGNRNINSHYRAAEDLSTKAGQLNLWFYCAAAFRQCQFPLIFMRQINEIGWFWISLDSFPIRKIARRSSRSNCRHWPNQASAHCQSKMRSWKEPRVIDGAIIKEVLSCSNCCTQCSYQRTQMHSLKAIARRHSRLMKFRLFALISFHWKATRFKRALHLPTIS